MFSNPNRHQTQFTCLLKENLLSSQKISTQLKRTSSECVTRKKTVEETEETAVEETVIENVELTKGVNHTDDVDTLAGIPLKPRRQNSRTQGSRVILSSRRSSSRRQNSRTQGSRGQYIYELLEEATTVLTQFARNTLGHKDEISSPTSKPHSTAQQIEIMKKLLDTVNEDLYEMIIEITTANSTSDFPQEVVTKVEVMKHLMEEANKTMQKGWH